MFRHASFARYASFCREFHGELLAQTIFSQVEVTDDVVIWWCRLTAACQPSAVDVVFRDLRKPGSLLRFLSGIGCAFSLRSGQQRLVRKDRLPGTTRQNPQGRSRHPARCMEDDCAEGTEVIDDWSVVGGKIYLNRLEDCKTETSVYRLDAAQQTASITTALGRPAPLLGRPQIAMATTSLNLFWCHQPSTGSIRSPASARSLPSPDPLNSSDYELKQVFYTPRTAPKYHVIAGKKGLKQDGTERLLMSGYGGFNVT